MDERTIQLNFRAAMAKADELDEIAEGLLQAINNDYEEAMQTVGAGWKGGNAESYLAKGGKLEEQMRNSVNQLKQAAGEIRRTAKRIYNAEMAALQIIQLRTY